MTRFVGLDVSQKLTAICVVDETGRRLWRGQCPTHPEQIEASVRRHAGDGAASGVETGPITPRLVHELRGLKLDVVCLDARHARAALKMQINKTDQNDAEGLVQLTHKLDGMLGLVGSVHLETDDLAAVEVQDQVQVEPETLDAARQEGHVPAPHLARTGRDVRAGRAAPTRRAGPTATLHLALCTQHAMEARLAAQIDALIRQHGDDPRRRHVSKAGLVGNGDNARPLILAEGLG